jgi:cell division protein FtsB
MFGRFSKTRKLLSRASNFLGTRRRKPRNITEIAVDMPVIESEKRKEIKKMIESWKTLIETKTKALEDQKSMLLSMKSINLQFATQHQAKSNTAFKKINSIKNPQEKAKFETLKERNDALRDENYKFNKELDTEFQEEASIVNRYIAKIREQIANLENKLKDPSIGGTRKWRKYKKRH